ncbi:MAG: hypothetical protein IIC27_00920 [Chloroflexi bacterium]|nr:hypothetical protein [Chloroflexota bacterium]
MFEIERFLEECRSALAESTPELALKELMERTVSTPDELLRAFGQPDTLDNVQPLYRSDDLTVMHFVWPPHMNLFPHNHCMWAVIGLYGGREDNTFYKRRADGQGLDTVNGKTMEGKDVAVLGVDVIHKVANPLMTYTPAIHVYGGDFFKPGRSEWADDASPEQPLGPDSIANAFAEANAYAAKLLAAQG